MKWLKYILMLMIIIPICGCNKIIVDKLPEGYFLNIKNNNIEVHSDIKLNDLIDSTNIVGDKTASINTHSLGINTYNYEFKIDGKNYLYHIYYNVVDSTSPQIYGGSNKTFYIGNSQDICDLVMYGDNFDKNPVCTIEGDYDFNKEAKYKVKAIVTDSSGNKTDFNMTLNIVKPQKNNNNSTTNTEPSKVLFSDVYNTYKNNNTKIGIDVSRWQGDVDYTAVKSAGAEFVMMRMGVQEDYNEEPKMDSKFLQNIKKAKEAGLEVGVYFYSMALTKEEAISQAKWVIDSLDGKKLNLPIVFDWESWSDWNNLNLSFYDINAISDAFLKTIESQGYNSMLYSSKFYLESIWKNKNKYPVWLAHYTNNTKTDYEGEFKMWQMCSDGQIPGINGDVDINVMFIK